MDKIIQLLCKWIADPREQKKLSETAECPEFSTEELKQILKRILRDMHRLKICTFDSFFVNIIKNFPFEFGVSGDLEILNESFHEEEAKQKVLKNILWETNGRRPSIAFLDEFKRATFGKDEKSLYVHLNKFIDEYHEYFLNVPEEIRWGVPERIWPSTPEAFRNNIDPRQQAEECRELMEKDDLNARQREMWRIFLEKAGNYSPMSSLTEEAEKIFKKLCEVIPSLEQGSASITLDRKKHNLTAGECDYLLKLVHHIIRCQLEAGLKVTQGIYKILKRYESDYDTMIRKKGKLSFKDVDFLLSAGSRGENDFSGLTQNISENDRLYINYRLDARFDHWLLDEFQDTDSLQWLVVRDLIEEIMQDDSGRRTFFYVGDIKQSIYQWRSGDPGLFSAVFEDFNKRFPCRIQKRSLLKSYRAGREIIDTVNRIFSGLQNGVIERIPQDIVDKLEFKEHETAREDIKGYACLLEIPKGKGEEKSSLLQKKAEAVIETINRIEPVKRDLSVAILTRTNDDSRAFAGLLEEAGIRTALEGSFSMVDNLFVPAFLSLVRLAEHPGDNFAWEHLRMTPLGIYTTDKSEVSMELLDDIYSYGFAYLIRKWRLKLERDGIEFDSFSRYRLDQFLSAAGIYDRSGNKNCLDFVEYIKNYKIPGTSSSDAVQVLTIHKAKGLEFDIVFLPELRDKGIVRADLEGIKIKRDNSRLPEWALHLPPRLIAEHVPVLKDFVKELDRQECYDALCVLYVAVTRAAKAVYMIMEPPAESSSTVYLADILTGALASDPPEEAPFAFGNAKCIYQTGNPEWYRHEKPTLASPRRERFEKRENPSLFIMRFDDRLNQAVPSDTEYYKRSGRVLFSDAYDKGLELGTAVHSLFGRLEWIDTANVEGIFNLWKQETEYTAELVQDAGHLFKTALQSEEVRILLKKPTPYSEVWMEKRFEIVVNNEWISGTFDRVTLVKDASGSIIEAVILDYKTDTADITDDLDKLLRKYSPQMNLYQKALSAMIKLPHEKIKKRLLLVKPCRVLNL